MIRTLQVFFFLLTPCAFAASAAADPASGEIRLHVDLRNPTQRIYSVSERIPAAAGALTLLYPKWIPGEHSASGPLDAVTGLIISNSSGDRLEWHRDLNDAFRIELTVPRGSPYIVVDFQLLSPATGGDFGHIVWASDRIEAVEWNQVVLYPAGRARAVVVQPSVSLPEGWEYGTSLETRSDRHGVVEFEPIPLDELVDSPLVAGQNFRRYALAPTGAAPVNLDLITDERDELAVPADQLQDLRNLVEQTNALFGSRHYRHYEFLLTLSDQLGNFGLEHAQSSDDRAPASFFSDHDWIVDRGFLLPHEMTHSWNGKYRRPAGLTTSDFNTPMRGDLLWVYEGLTAYLGDVLAARSGIWTPEQHRDNLALAAADMADRPGRQWRSLQDTADSGPVIYYSAEEWSSQRRGTDFYEEGALLWLDVDTKLRELSADTRSVDDFVRKFCGADPGIVGVKPYDFDDVTAILNSVARYDWARFLRDRLDSHSAAPLDGIARSGWRLIYTSTPSDALRARQSTHKLLDHSSSLGLVIGASADNSGRVLDVVWNGPAFRAGLAPGMKIVAVNSRAFDPERLNQALLSAQSGGTPVQFLVQNGSSFATLSIDYRGGPRYPRLERIETARDRLTAIVSPKQELH